MDGQLPTFAFVRQEVYALLGDCEDWLRSDWAPGQGPNDDQAAALSVARTKIAQARGSLDKAARVASS